MSTKLCKWFSSGSLRMPITYQDEEIYNGELRMWIFACYRGHNLPSLRISFFSSLLVSPQKRSSTSARPRQSWWVVLRGFGLARTLGAAPPAKGHLREGALRQEGQSWFG